MAERVCPWWIGYLLACPLRRLIQDPHRILAPYAEPGMTVADLGCAMGFFSLPLARLVGPQGKVICVDLQEKMLASLRRRARRAGLLDRLDLKLCPADSLGLDDREEAFDFALAFAMVHELPSPETFFREVYRALKPGGRLLVVEPRGHVTESAFATTVSLAAQSGFEEIDRPRISISHSVCLRRQ